MDATLVRDAAGGDGSSHDAAIVDATVADANVTDAAVTDAAVTDGGTVTSDGGATDAMVADGGATPPPPIFGVTITNPWVVGTSSEALLDSRLSALVGPTGRRPTARVVFDEGIDRVFHRTGLDASAYVPLVTAIRMHADVMGELLDSLYVPTYTVAQYQARACEYRATLGNLVDIFEIGNEVNGEWLGTNVLAKILAAIEVFRADATTFATLCPGFSLLPDERPFKLALTLYENGPYDGGMATADNCWSDPEHAMLRWAQTNFGSGASADAQRLGGELDYVLVSYYEDDCNGLQPTWQDVFDALGAIFPGAALGFGECGTTHASSKVSYVQRYYQGMDSSDPAFANMHVTDPRYVGGFFWWYFSDDLSNDAVNAALVASLAGPFWNR